jgi:hypothetical protein
MITLRNFSREEFFGGVLKIFVSLFLVVRHLLSPGFAGLSSADAVVNDNGHWSSALSPLRAATGCLIVGKCASRHRNASMIQASVHKRDIGNEPHGCGGELGLIGRRSGTYLR